jgi:hypothetical protein
MSPQPTPRAAPRRVLEDASGRRLRRMRWVGRATALLFLVWLALVILGGLGVGPVGRLPLGNVLRPSAGPPPLRHIPRAVAPKPADLVRALPAPVLPSAAATTPSATHGKSSVAPGHTKTTTTMTTTTSKLLPGRSGVAPGHTKTTVTITTTRGKSAVAPGHVKHTTTTTTTATTTTVPGKKLGHGKKP